MCVHACVCMCVYVCVCMCVYVCMRVCVHVCLYAVKITMLDKITVLLEICYMFQINKT